MIMNQNPRHCLCLIRLLFIYYLLINQIVHMNLLITIYYIHKYLFVRGQVLPEIVQSIEVTSSFKNLTRGFLGSVNL